MLQTQSLVLKAISRKISSLSDEKYQDIIKTIDFGPQVSSYLNLNILYTIHSALCFDEGSNIFVYSGKFRDATVWIGLPGSDMEHATYVPPLPKDVPSLINELLESWNENYKTLIESNKNEIIIAITNFYHKFLSVHPFLDANGRVAMFLLNQQVKDLLDFDGFIKVNKDYRYYMALQEADKGNINNLVQIIFGVSGCKLL